MAAVNKIGFNYEEREKDTAKWESPEDVIHYVTAGLKYLSNTNNDIGLETIEKRKHWIDHMHQAMKCLEILE